MTKRARQESFEQKVGECRPMLDKVCRLYARPEDRDDLGGEIVLQLWRAFPRFDPSMRFSTWMWRIALNVAISHARRETRRPRTVEMQEIAAEAPSEEARLLYRMVEELDPLNRALMLLHLEGHSHAEAADVLGLSATNVATKISRIKDAMKKRIER